MLRPERFQGFSIFGFKVTAFFLKGLYVVEVPEIRSRI
jgi:hypothetical protein